MRPNTKLSGWISYGFALAGLLLSSVPLLFGLDLIRDWLRVRHGPGAYFDYQYLLSGSAWVIAATIGLIPVLHASFKSAPNKFVSVWAIAVGLTGAYLIPEFDPRTSMLTTTSAVTREFEQSLIAWDEAHGRFPMDAKELVDAVRIKPLSGPPIFRYPGEIIPYSLKFIPDAAGPYEHQDADKPGTFVYAVRNNYEEFWLTMTTLDRPVGGHTVFLHAPGGGNTLWVKTRRHRDGIEHQTAK